MNAKPHLDIGGAPRRHWWAVLVAVLLAGGLLLAACGGGGGPGVAGAGNTSRTTDPSSNSGGGFPTGNSAKDQAERQADLLKYSKCMRAHGLSDFPDPSNGGIKLQAGQGGDLNPSSPKFQAAEKACKKYMPGGNLTPAQKAAANARAVKYAHCMQTHGVPNFPEPNGQGVIQINGNAPGLDPSSPQFQHAQKACKRYDNGFGTLIKRSLPGGGRSNGNSVGNS